MRAVVEAWSVYLNVSKEPVFTARRNGTDVVVPLMVLRPVLNWYFLIRGEPGTPSLYRREGSRAAFALYTAQVDDARGRPGSAGLIASSPDHPKIWAPEKSVEIPIFKMIFNNPLLTA